MYIYALLGESHELWTYRHIFIILVIIILSSYFITFLLLSLFSSASFVFTIVCFIRSFPSLGLVILHILEHKG